MTGGGGRARTAPQLLTAAAARGPAGEAPVSQRAESPNCFADDRGSIPGLVQAVRRALRMQPGEGKIASLVVPIPLGSGE
ncbi:hypothetical protein ACIP4Y_36670 [Streptomyces sp. NPDC088810]|uniref:hypothetical protein n=1 Tax=Streptomyces sp. NPDC088810 TaxID=3365904 RepID=UPI003825D0D7